jgi:hypothetical protein
LIKMDLSATCLSTVKVSLSELSSWTIFVQGCGVV